MAQQIINVGSAPNDGTGDVLRNSQIKANANFTELYNTRGDMFKSVYDIDDDGIVDSAKKEIVQFINKSGATITKGTIVYLKSTSSSSTYPEVIKANATTEATSSKTIGAVYEDVLNNATGFIVTSGEVRNLNTSAYVIGDKLWLSTTDGLVTTTIPTQPNHAVFIGTVTRSQTVNGRILYAIQNGYELNELHNVLITTPANNQVLTYESATSLWKNKDAGGGSSVQSVTGDSVDNTDTLNPIINAIPLSGTTVGSPVSGDIEVLNTFINALGKTGLAISSDDNFVSLKRGDNQVVLGNEDYLLIDFPISANGLRGGQDFTPNITDLDYVQKKYVDNLVNTATNTATVTVELVNSLSTDFYAPYDLRINTTNTIFGVGTITLKVNDVAYTLTDLIIKGDKITVETNSESVFNLDIIYE